jgi:hypothetical protein
MSRILRSSGSEKYRVGVRITSGHNVEKRAGGVFYTTDVFFSLKFPGIHHRLA